MHLPTIPLLIKENIFNILIYTLHTERKKGESTILSKLKPVVLLYVFLECGWMDKRSQNMRQEFPAHPIYLTKIITVKSSYQLCDTL